MSGVVVAKIEGVDVSAGLTKRQYRLLLAAGLRTLAGKNSVSEIVRQYLPSGVIGMKANCLTGKRNSTALPLTEALGDLLVEAGFKENDIVVWDRTNRELQAAGYLLNASFSGRRCLGTDSNGVGYSQTFYTSGDVNSLVTEVLTRMVHYNINLPVLKDHSLAGMSAGLKNMYGAIHNPNKYHANNCSPFCAHISNLEPIRNKNRLTVLDAVRVQFDRGPGYMAAYMDDYGGLVISDDPVACDRVGLEILLHFRRKHGLPSLEDAGRPVRYLQAAAQLGLGKADMDLIDLKAVIVREDGSQRTGELF